MEYRLTEVPDHSHSTVVEDNMNRLTHSLLVLALLLTPASGLAGQTSAPTIKDANTARDYALRCPGCGHLYTGETSKGAILATVGIGSLIGGSILSLTTEPTVECTTGEYYSCSTGSSPYTPLIVGSLGYLATAIYSFIDAGPSATRMNTRNGFTVGMVTLTPVFNPSVSGGAEVGIRLGR
jgi:hypothetical protein